MSRFRGRRALTACAIAAVFAASGCTSTLKTFEGKDRTTCALVGGLLGAGAGAAIANPNHSHDEPGDWAVGSGVGAATGAALGYMLCRPVAAMAQPPTARATATPSSGQAPLRVDLRGVGSDADGRVVGYAWDLGDGSRASGASVTHTYQRPGNYTPMLTVTDNDGMTARASARVSVAQAPAPAPAPKVTRRIVLRGVTFEFDSDVLRPEARSTLETAVEVLKESAGVRVEVAGHADATGPDAYNLSLSERRARSVVEFLVGRGIPRSSLVPVGYGESRPVADNSTREGRAQNRRVELNVLQ